MTPEEFVNKWSKIQQTERASAQTHFNDICALVGHLPPHEFDSVGRIFSFETGTVKPDGRKGFADVFYRAHFIWEYKGLHADLDQAYRQLLLYRESLQNPPLLITSDTRIIIIHTNFNDCPRFIYRIGFDDILQGPGLALLKRAFFDPYSFRPGITKEEITVANSLAFLGVADGLKAHKRLTGEDYSPEQLSHFLGKLLFCLFAEDMGFLAPQAFSQMIAEAVKNPQDVDLQHGLYSLFEAMKNGGRAYMYRIRWFNGSLFDDDFVPSLPADFAYHLYQACEQDWSAIEPSIFGTIFERVIDDSKRSQLGAHYTSAADIELVINPIVMQPLRDRWYYLQQEVKRLLLNSDRPGHEEQAHTLLAQFAAEIGQYRVLDPACGSGNFLYVALRKLLDLQQEVISFAERRNLPEIPLSVSPQQLYGLEIDPYAFELSQITSWIGYLQWRMENGYKNISEPLLQKLHNIKRMDSILGEDEQGQPFEPDWPETEAIVGNPPFLGWYKLRQELGDNYVSRLFKVYANRIPGSSDLVCYWYERAKNQLLKGKAQRAGFLATNSIRGGANRRVLERIKEVGNIFVAWSDRKWLLAGAAVRVSIIGFDLGQETKNFLDGQRVTNINSDLTAGRDITQAKKLTENRGIAFIGGMKKGSFDISDELAQKMLLAPNKSLKPNSDVVWRWVNAFDIVRRPRNMWIIDFGLFITEEEARQYEWPYQHLLETVKPQRLAVRNPRERTFWWIHGRPAPDLRKATTHLKRYIVTPRVSKHRIFTFLPKDIVADGATVVYAREDDYFLGVLHSKIHAFWSLRQGTSLEDRPRYTPTTCFATFPFPWQPGQEPLDDPLYQEIAYWGKTLYEWREKWLNPAGPGAGVVDANYQKLLKQRTMSNLYNALEYYRATIKAEKPFSPAEFLAIATKAVTLTDVENLDVIHTHLDEAVYNAYGWPTTIPDSELVDCLTLLNHERVLLNGEATDEPEEEDEFEEDE